MADLVRVRDNGFEFNMLRSRAESLDLEILDEPVARRDGTLRRTTRANGRPAKPKTTVAEAAARKKKTAASGSDVPAETAEEASA